MNTLFLLVLAGLAVFIANWLYQKNKKKKEHRLIPPYIEALHLLLDGKQAEAVEKLKKTIREDTDNIMAYIKLGDMFREQGDPVRAAKIHRNLLIRGDLTQEETELTFQHLILDYCDANLFNRAIDIAERLIQKNKKNIASQKLLLSLYEKKGDWDKAFFYRQTLNKWLKRKDQDILALYKVQVGIALTRNQQEREGRIRFREALRLHKKCVLAYLNWGDSYRREGRNEDAFRVWREFVKKVPEWAHLAFDRLKDVLYDLGLYSELEEIYLEILQKKPKDPASSINLVDLYWKQGRTEKALALCRKTVEEHPENMQCRHLLIQLLHERGEDSEAVGEALRLTESEAVAVYACPACGEKGKEPLWYCPHCGQWNSYSTKPTR
jgi:lipopolysaccharide biosynthesis regulator YciM